MPRPNVGELDARARQLAGGAGILLAAAAWRKHPILAAAATIAAVDLLATAAARWCWANELMGLDTRQLDVAAALRPQAVRT
ncbi:MAG TPA: YgaP-like transmembrane domain [Candidatus Thermoplasmatota archaeon]|nr:YgaP-like transmembrane domain [Candidatus Thermoplasmatota archaeon]